MNRTGFQQLAEVRIREAEALLAAGLWDGAYYLAGYAVECGLKACILAHVDRTGVIFLEKDYSTRCWTHDPAKLVEVADLKPVLGPALAADPTLNANWAAVVRWKETSRYQRTDEPTARQLFDAITEPAHGVMTWIKRHW